jgi:hypothetical protein
MTTDPDRRKGEAGGRDRLPWQRAALLVGLLSVAGWVLILLVSRWLLG